MAALGLVLGSFVTALTHRLPRARSVAHGRSACAACGHTLGPRDLVPLLSWIVQRGRCRYCGGVISYRYPMIEFAMLVSFVIAALVVRDEIHLVLLLALSVVMVALVVLDLEQGRLPDGLVLVLAFLALTWRWNTDQAIGTAFIEAAAVFAVLILLNAGFRFLTRTPGLGMGDAKLLAAASLALDPPSLLWFLSVAGIAGFVFGMLWRYRARTSHFPFGPPVLVSFWVSLVWAGPALEWLTTAVHGSPV